MTNLQDVREMFPIVRLSSYLLVEELDRFSKSLSAIDRAIFFESYLETLNKKYTWACARGFNDLMIKYAEASAMLRYMLEEQKGSGHDIMTTQTISLTSDVKFDKSEKF